jgi:hypothetical protein
LIDGLDSRQACLPQAGRKGFNLVAPLGKKEVSAQSLPTAGRPPSRKGVFSLGLCAFAPKKQITHTKALRAYLIPLHLSAAADRAFLLGQKKSS